MVGAHKASLGEAFRAWLSDESTVRSAVLFGSRVWADDSVEIGHDWSDFDFHLVASKSKRLEAVDWSMVMPDQKFCFQAIRPATGGVRKVTAVFSTGQVDLVVVSAWQMRMASWAFRFGGQHRHRGLQVALNEMATCLASGFRFWKGQKQWERFYDRISREMPGVRLSDAETVSIANVFLCELLWVLQKLDRRELAAAQSALHRQLGETNFRLVRELRLRRKQPLPSFGIGRRVESFLSPTELSWVSISSRLDRVELHRAAMQSFAGMRCLMAELNPAWSVPAGYDDLVRLQGLGAVLPG